MLPIFILSSLLILTKAQKDPASRQLETFKQNHPKPIGLLTTSYGVPIEYTEATSSINSDILRNTFFMESVTHFVRERIPVRTVHAKGTGAFGYLEITNDISKYCRAKIFSKIGKRTKLVARFSLAVSEKGAPDTSREPRGLALKFYTEDGNLDIVCLHTPIYVYKDPLLFTTFAHVIKRNPATDLRDMNMLWDFITLRPEALFVFLLVFGDSGIPDGYRHMPAFNIQTTQTVNKDGESYFFRFHFLPDAGIKYLHTDEATKIAGEDPDYATRDLYNAIAEGKFPSWTMYAQILSIEQVRNAKLDVFDVTKILPEKDYPLQRIGKVVFNRNPVNQFAEIEQLAFNPGNFPDGFVGGPDKLFESRQLVYREAHLYRLGANFDKMSVNRPIDKVLTYLRDGVGPVGTNGKDGPNYYPNSFSGPIPCRDKNDTKLLKIFQNAEANNFDQIRDFYENQMTSDARDRLIETLVMVLSGVSNQIQERAVKLILSIQSDLGTRVLKGLQSSCNL